LAKLGTVTLWTLLQAFNCNANAASSSSSGSAKGFAEYNSTPSAAISSALPTEARPVSPKTDSTPPFQPPTDAEPAGLSEEHRRVLAEIPEERIFGSPVEHFTVSNEYRHDLWFPFLRGLGGAYVGVASDQNYTLIAAARSEFAFLIDLDRQVVDLHGIYAALIADSADPEAFLALMSNKPAARRRSREVLLGALAGRTSADRARVMGFFDAQREVLSEYLEKVQQQTGSWLADPNAYRYIRAMFNTGRIRVLQGNLAGRKTMAGIAASAQALGKAIHVLYLSNAEEYLFYTDRFASNVSALPRSPASLLLRTIHDRFLGWESCGEGDRRWNYQVQQLDDFARRLGERGRGRNSNRTSMLDLTLAEGVVQRRTRGVSVIAPTKPEIGKEIVTEISSPSSHD